MGVSLLLLGVSFFDISLTLLTNLFRKFIVYVKFDPLYSHNSRNTNTSYQMSSSTNKESDYCSFYCCMGEEELLLELTDPSTSAAGAYSAFSSYSEHESELISWTLLTSITSSSGPSLSFDGFLARLLLVLPKDLNSGLSIKNCYWMALYPCCLLSNSSM